MIDRSQRKFIRPTPRSTCNQDFHCYAANELFLPWDQLSQRAKDEFDNNGPIPCEGGGVPGPWCDNCRFGSIGEPDVEFH